jgi:16S rRNA (cytosine967-C5)-methyltransferase
VVEQVIARTNTRRVSVADLLERLAVSGVLNSDANLRSVVRGETLRTLPGVHSCDGFFATVLEAES